MDKDEEEGLRAFALTVDAGDPPEYRPLAIERDGRRAAVIEVCATWQEEERTGFRVRLSDGLEALLYYVPELDLWSGVCRAPANGFSVIPRT